MPQVRVAGATQDLGTGHAQAVVLHGAYAVSVAGRDKAGPASAGIELRIGAEQGRVATDAAVGAAVMAVVILAAAHRLGAFLPAHGVLLRADLLPPLRLRLDDLYGFAHRTSVASVRVRVCQSLTSLVARSQVDHDSYCDTWLHSGSGHRSSSNWRISPIRE